jgi:hypothetical protein
MEYAIDRKYDTYSVSQYTNHPNNLIYSIKPKRICCGSHLRGQQCYGCPMR